MTAYHAPTRTFSVFVAAPFHTVWQVRINADITSATSVANVTIPDGIVTRENPCVALDALSDGSLLMTLQDGSFYIVGSTVTKVDGSALDPSNPVGSTVLRAATPLLNNQWAGVVLLGGGPRTAIPFCTFTGSAGSWKATCRQAPYTYRLFRHDWFHMHPHIPITANTPPPANNTWDIIAYVAGNFDAVLKCKFNPDAPSATCSHIVESLQNFNWEYNQEDSQECDDTWKMGTGYPDGTIYAQMSQPQEPKKRAARKVLQDPTATTALVYFTEKGNFVDPAIEPFIFGMSGIHYVSL